MTCDRSDPTAISLAEALSDASKRGTELSMIWPGSSSFAGPIMADPFVVVIRDDSELASGPADFHRPSLDLFISRVDTVIINHLGYDPKIYVSVLSAATQLLRCMAIIETPGHADEWARLLDPHLKTYHYLTERTSDGVQWRRR